MLPLDRRLKHLESDEGTNDLHAPRGRTRTAPDEGEHHEDAEGEFREVVEVGGAVAGGRPQRDHREGRQTQAVEERRLLSGDLRMDPPFESVRHGP